MSQSKFRYQCSLVFLIIKLSFISGQICENNDIPDFFVSYIQMKSSLYYLF